MRTRIWVRNVDFEELHRKRIPRVLVDSSQRRRRHLSKEYHLNHLAVPLELEAWRINISYAP